MREAITFALQLSESAPTLSVEIQVVPGTGTNRVLSQVQSPTVPVEVRQAILAAITAEYVDAKEDAVGDFLDSADLSSLGAHGADIVERFIERRVRKAIEAAGDGDLPALAHATAAAEIAAIDLEMQAQSWEVPRAASVASELRQAILDSFTREYVEDVEGAVGDYFTVAEAELCEAFGRGADRMLERILEKRVRRAAAEGGAEAAKEEIMAIDSEDWSAILPPRRSDSDSDSGSSDSDSSSESESEAEEEEEAEAKLSVPNSTSATVVPAQTALESGTSVQIIGRCFGGYFHSNHGEGQGMSWGGKNDEVNWVLEFDDPVSSERGQMDVHIRSRTTGLYFHSNHDEGMGMSWGGKRGDLNWRMEWDGKLHSGMEVHLFGKGLGKYLHSNAPEACGMSWGSLHQSAEGLNWTLEWDEANESDESCRKKSSPSYEEAVCKTPLQDASCADWAEMLCSGLVSVSFLHSIGALDHSIKEEALHRARELQREKNKEAFFSMHHSALNKADPVHYDAIVHAIENDESCVLSVFKVTGSMVREWMAMQDELKRYY